jgi:hypothetical protein
MWAAFSRVQVPAGDGRPILWDRRLHTRLPAEFCLVHHGLARHPIPQLTSICLWQLTLTFLVPGKLSWWCGSARPTLLTQAAWELSRELNPLA